MYSSYGRGVYPTVMPNDVIKDTNIDYVFLGHAEERLDKFINLLQENAVAKLECFSGIGFKRGGVSIINPFREFIGDIAEMVKPDYSEIDLNLYIEGEKASPANFIVASDERSATVITSYGCPYNCVFCATRTISGHKVAYRTVSDVMEEIDYLVKEYGVNVITFVDDCLLTKRERAIDLFEQIILKNYKLDIRIGTVAAWQLDDELLNVMKKAGCSRFGISVESGCERVLREIIHKPLKKEIIKPLVNKCRELDILMTANFVIGFPGETWDEIRESLRFAEECDFDLINIHIATVLPETDLYRIAKEQELLPKDFSFYNEVNFGFGKGNITTDEFTPKELSVIRDYEWDRINFSTAQKRKRACRIMGITEEELYKHRQMTRREYGMYF